MKVAVTLDDTLLNEAIELTGISQKKQLLNEALSELVRIYKRRGLLSLENSNIWEEPDGNNFRDTAR
ncbi:MAG: type II toxin-antitoxin system VapB family antitoxin [Chitinispirillia bacterium]|nr:type II toxin-antitoxin system VapB family antitoxin [Chitinispirillia bacterium]MCL2269309.1 type II toxin-antitoxin system VapB family antitoxin [Chitinispirillia bacterium]